MNTPTTTSIVTLPQSYVVNDAEYAPVKTGKLPMGGEQNDQVVADYLNQTQLAAAAPVTPQIPKPMTTTGIEVKQQLTAELKKIKFSQEVAQALLQEKLAGLVEDFMADPSPDNERVLLNALACVLLAGAGSANVDLIKSMAGATSMADEVKKVMKDAITALDNVKEGESPKEAYDRLSKQMSDLTTNFIDNPTEESAYKLGIALICLLTEIQKVKLTTQAQLAGLMNKLGFESAQHQATATIEQGKAALWGGLSMAVTTVAMAVAGYGVQKAGFMKRDEAFNHETEVRKLELNLEEKKFVQQKNESLKRYNLQREKDGRYKEGSGYDQHDTEYKQRIAQLQDQWKRENRLMKSWGPDAQERHQPPLSRADKEVWKEQYEAIKKSRDAINAQMRAEEYGQAESLRYRQEAQPQDYFPTDYKRSAFGEGGSVFEEEQAKKGWFDSFRSRTDDKAPHKGGRAYDAKKLDESGANIYNPDDKVTRLSWLREEIHKLNMLADDYQAKGHAAVSSLGVAQVAQTFTNTLQKEEEAKALMDSAEANIYRELVSLAMQAYSAADAFMNTLINNILEALLRAPVEANKALAGGGMGRG